jgi:hypothetical protein
MCGGPGAIAEDAARDEARKEAGFERRTEGFPGHGRLVQREAAKGIVPDREVKTGLWGETRGPPQAIRRSGKAGALLLPVKGGGGLIDAGWVGETAREGMEKLHALRRGCLMKGRK